MNNQNTQILDRILHAIITLAVLALAWSLFTNKGINSNVEIFASSIVGAVIAYWFSTMSNSSNKNTTSS
jgi:mannose/fructose/N-acetylgalactosamine-specific phosphotransferase system component IID